MNRDKELEAMTESIGEALKHNISCDIQYITISYDKGGIARALYNAGYRKSTDVAREIFEAFRAEIRSEIAENETLFAFAEDKHDFYEGRIDAYRTAINCLAELKKKYTEGCNG